MIDHEVITRGSLHVSVGCHQLPCGYCLCLTLSLPLCVTLIFRIKYNLFYYLIQQKLFSPSLVITSTEKKKNVSNILMSTSS